VNLDNGNTHMSKHPGMPVDLEVFLANGRYSGSECGFDRKQEVMVEAPGRLFDFVFRCELSWIA
jgi:hypothetical protein